VGRRRAPAEILGDGGFGDLNAQLLEFAVNAGRTPQGICAMHLLDQCSNVNTPMAGVIKAHDACVAVAASFEKKGGTFLLAKAALGQRAGGRLQTLMLSSGQAISAGTFVFAAGPWLLTLFPDVMKNKLMVAKRGYYMVGTPPGDNRFAVPNLPNT
jgi:glycine/D-amino acid oxidase-like deaminating enzyme